MESFEFNPATYGDVCSDLLSGKDLPPLGPGHPRASVADRLRALTHEQLFRDATLRDRSMAYCCLAGIWLWFDYLTESHQISQRIPSPTGSYWHGIMHRREPDYPNAEYWFDKVGDHPVFQPLAVAATQLVGDSGALDVGDVLAEDRRWDPYRFIDLCRRHAGKATEAEQLCRGIARVEWQLLFDYCHRRAIGG